MNDISSFQWGVAIGASLAAAVLDVRFRRIPNALTLPLVVSGLAVAVWLDGWSGLGSALAGCFVVALPYVLLFLLGGGAGDAKMMGGLGAWLGLHDGVFVLVTVAIIGGLFGLIKMLADRDRKSRLGGFFAGIYVFLTTARGGKKDWDLLRPQDGRQGGDETDNENRHGSEAMMPYGPAIFLGTCIGAVVVRLWQG